MNDIERARAKREAAKPHHTKGMQCLACRHGVDTVVIAVFPVGTDESTLECTRCGARQSSTYHLPEADA